MSLGRLDPPDRVDRAMGVGSRHGYRSHHLQSPRARPRIRHPARLPLPGEELRQDRRERRGLDHVRLAPSVRYVALGSAAASARIPFRIHAGLLPPSIASVGMVARPSAPPATACRLVLLDDRDVVRAACARPP